MHKRYTLTPIQKAQKILDQKGCCAKCRFELVAGDIQYDHRCPIWKRPKEPYTKAEEYALQDALCGLCHKHKTRKEAAERAHHKRLETARAALVGGVAKKVKPKIANRGWGNKHLKKKLSGEVVKR